MKEIREVKVENLTHASWNPRQESELQAEHPEMRKLVESIKRNGLLQPIGVWADSPEGELVIYGNRRLAAAKIAEMEEITATVYTGIDEAIARLLTREENENRFGINPIADAKLLKEAVDRGMSQIEIAAASGVSEATICRRMKLVSLDKEIIEALDGKEVDTKALEMIAAYPADLQRKAKRDLESRARYSRVKASDVNCVFGNITTEIAKNIWPFSGERGTELWNRCTHCSMYTGAQPELFDNESPSKCHRCLDVKCFKKMEIEARDAEIKRVIDGCESYELVKSQWDEPFHSLAQKRRSKKNPYPWVYWDKWNHRAEVRWYTYPSEYEADQVRAKAEKRAADEAKRATDEKRDANLLSCMKKFAAYFCGENACGPFFDENGCNTENVSAEILERMEDRAQGVFINLIKQCTADRRDPEAFLRTLFWDLRVDAVVACTDADDAPAAIEKFLHGKTIADRLAGFFVLFPDFVMDLACWNRYDDRASSLSRKWVMNRTTDTGITNEEYEAFLEYIENE